MAIVILTTGGTIAMRFSQDSGGAIPMLSGNDFSAGMGDGLPPHRFEEFLNVPSSHLSLDDIWRLKSRVEKLLSEEDVEGVVVTHGTDTLEETAILLDLTVESQKPVVLTGAMRTAGEPGYDGFSNLIDAVRTASEPEAEGLGTLVVMNGEIHRARAVTKTHTSAVETFCSPGRGPLGRVDRRAVVIDRRVTRIVLSTDELESSVALIKLAIGMDSSFIDYSIQQGIKGVVVETYGGGRIPPALLPSFEKAKENGIVLVAVSRCPTGRLGDPYAYEGSFTTLERMGFLFTDGLNGQKARIQLAVVLGAADSEVDAEKIWRRNFPFI